MTDTLTFSNAPTQGSAGVASGVFVLKLTSVIPSLVDITINTGNVLDVVSIVGFEGSASTSPYQWTTGTPLGDALAFTITPSACSTAPRTITITVSGATWNLPAPFIYSIGTIPVIVPGSAFTDTDFIALNLPDGFSFNKNGVIRPLADGIAGILAMPQVNGVKELALATIYQMIEDQQFKSETIGRYSYMRDGMKQSDYWRLQAAGSQLSAQAPGVIVRRDYGAMCGGIL